MSVFNCNITYRKIDGDSYQSTKNKLMSQGYVDQYWNIKVDVATWRKGRSELNQFASSKLGRDVNLFEEKKLLNGIRAVPNMMLFSMIDNWNYEAKRNALTNDQKQAEMRAFREEMNNLSEEVNYEPRREQQDIMKEVYSTIEQPIDSFIPATKITTVQKQLDAFNKLNTGKVLSLIEIPANGKYLIKSEYKSDYMFKTSPIEMEIEQEEFPMTDSNSNFGVKCITAP